MYSKVFLLTTAIAATARAQCPAIWSTVASDLKANLFSSCNDDARAAIRLPFHDCYAGACDGSIILSDECTTRGENTQLVGICASLGNVSTQYGVGVGDLIQVAGGKSFSDITFALKMRHLKTHIVKQLSRSDNAHQAQQSP